MLEEWKERVFRQNLRLVQCGLVVLTWGNVSAFDSETGLCIIKPSGVSYDTMKAEDMVVVNLDGQVVEGHLRPSSDTPTHLYLYRHFPKIRGIVHTHSSNAVAWAQAGRSIPPFGTTHADVFYGEIPCSRPLTREEIETDYEKNTGKVIVETFEKRDYEAVPGILIQNHGPFSWGVSCEKAVENAVTLEEVAKMARFTRQIREDTPEVDRYLSDKHYFRKHGENAYYGQT